MSRYTNKNEYDILCLHCSSAKEKKARNFIPKSNTKHNMVTYVAFVFTIILTFVEFFSFIWQCWVSVWFASAGSQQLLPLCSSGHVRSHTVSSPLQHYVVPVFPTVLISLEISCTPALIIAVGFQTLLRGISFFDAWVNVLITNFPYNFIHLDLLQIPTFVQQ